MVYGLRKGERPAGITRVRDTARNDIDGSSPGGLELLCRQRRNWMMSDEIHGRKSQLGKSGTFPARTMVAARALQKCGSSGYLQTALTALCAAGLFSVLYLIRGFYPFGDGSIVITDLYSQYVPLLYRFYDVVTGQKNLFLDFNVSGGANLYVDTINEVLDPFNYVLLLFGRDRLYQAVNVVLLLYVTAAAASADFFLLKMFPKNRKWNVVLSLCYAFSGYMAYNYQIIKWMYFPVLFPLFCLALRRLIREKKGGWYAFLLGYQLVLSVQLGFMTLLFVLFGSGIWFYSCEWVMRTRRRRSKELSVRFVDCCEGKKEDVRIAMCRLGCYTVIGLLLSGAVLLPNIQILLSSSRAGENLSYPGVMKRHGLDDLFERLFQIAHPVLLSMFVWAFAGWRRKKCRFADLPGEGRFLFLLNGFLWLTVLLQPANLLWHMGSYVCFPVRYAYMVLLSGICLTKWLLTMREDEQDDAAGEKRKKAIEWFAPLCAAALCMAACLLTYTFGDRIVQGFSSLAISLMCPKETLVVCLILLLFFAAGLCSLTGAERRRTVTGVAALCGICLNLFIFLPPDYGVRLSNEAAYRKMTQQAAAAVQEEADSGADSASAQQPDAFGQTAQLRFAGDDVLHRVKDDPGLPLNAALVNRRSTLTGYFPTASQSFKNAMESLGYLVPWVATQSVGGTAISDELLSECLLFEQDASELAFQSDSVLGRQEELSVFVSGKSCLERITGSSLETDQKGAALLAVEGERTVYLDPGRTADSFRIFVNGKEAEVPEAASAFSAHRIVEAGTFQDERAEILVTDQNGTALSLEEMEFGLLDRKAWREKAARQLTGEELAIDSPGGRIRVSLADAEEGQTIFLPFAFLRGWDCVLNGKHVDITSVFGGFLGITTCAGGNEIVLKFTPPGLWVGMLLTGLGVIGLAGGAVWERSYGKRNSGREGGRPETAVGALYGIALAAGLLAVYVIPAAGLICYLAGKVLGIF